MYISIKKILAIFIAIIMVATMSAGCARNSENDNDSSNDTISGANVSHPDTLYRSEIIPFPALPDGYTNIDIVVLAENRVYFTAFIDWDGNYTYSVYKLFSMEVDGTNLVELPNYNPGSFPPEVSEGYVIINAFHIDNEGYLWVSELRSLHGQSPPDGLSEHILRKLDNTGAEIAKIDLSNLAGLSDLFYVHTINVDNKGNLYIASETNIYILDNQGNLLFSLDNPGWLTNFVWLSDGTVAFVEWQVQQDGRTYLKKIDIESKSWGEIISLPTDIQWIHSVFSGSGEYLYLYNDSSFLNGVISETGETANILNWVNSTLSSGDITGVMFLPDGRVAAIRQPLMYTAGSTSPTELILLTEISIDELPEKKQLTLGTLDFDSSTRYAVEQFNRSSNTHEIQIIDYSQFNTHDDWSPGLLRLSTDIIAGNAPDILEIRNMPIQNYVSKGLLVDLYPYLDADPELSRDSLLESVLKASEIDGSLYRIVPSFFIGTIFGNPSVLGSYPGWNFDEFMEVLNANPQADLPLGPVNSKMTFLSLALRSNMDNYVDIASGTASFENDDFIALLELANTFPPEGDMNSSTTQHSLIANGRQIMEMWFFYDFVSYPVYRTMFGGELVFKGFPTENRDGNSFMPDTCIAITTTCEEPDVAWELVRLLLLEDYQREMVFYSFPVNRTIFEERLADAMSPPPGIVMSTGPGFILEDPEDIAISQEEADKLRDFVDNITRIRSYDDTLWTIISEGAEDYFNGRGTAKDAARIIQSRVSIYLSEQS